jgi:hypothetical protein
MRDESPRPPDAAALDEARLRELAARGNAVVRVRLPTGPCFCRVLELRPRRGRRPAQLVVDVAGIATPVALADVIAAPE